MCDYSNHGEPWVYEDAVVAKVDKEPTVYTETETADETEDEWSMKQKASLAFVGLAAAGLLAAGGMFVAKKLKSD